MCDGASGHCPRLFPPLPRRRSGRGLGRGQSNLTNRRGGLSKEILLSPSLSSISWRRGGLFLELSGAVLRCALASLTRKKFRVLRAATGYFDAVISWQNSAPL